MDNRVVSGFVYLFVIAQVVFARAAMAQGHEGAPRVLSEQMVGVMFAIGIVAIAGAWWRSR